MMDYSKMTAEQIANSLPDIMKELGESLPLEQRHLFNAPAQRMMNLVKVDAKNMTPEEIQAAMSEAMFKLDKIKNDALANLK